MEPGDLVPEEVVVLETVGRVDDFIQAVEAVPGMEWLAEVDTDEIPPDDDFFALAGDGTTPSDKFLRGRLFMVFTNQEALQQMMSLWKTLRSGKTLPQGLKKWIPIFRQTLEMRPWGVQDRLLETGVLKDWQARVEYDQKVVPCAIELWYRREPRQRQAAQDRVVALVEDMAGRVVADTDIEAIAYHALLVDLPVPRVHPLFESAEADIELIHCEQIQFFRATGQMAVSFTDQEKGGDVKAVADTPPVGSPVVALLDGVPLEKHRWLDGRLEVDDPDDLASDSQARMRRHGTAMASLILHGDIGKNERPLPRPLYVRPILQPDLRRRDAETVTEAEPEGTLIVDLVHRAVRRLFEADGEEPPAAPHISVVNLSIGIADRPFAQALSPLARLIDWLAWKYNVLFVVSAGNHSQDISLLPGDESDSLLPIDIQEQVIRSVAADTRNRRLLSPAEAVNAITVASAHDDSSVEPPPPDFDDPYTCAVLPSPINAQGMGYRRGIKPDILAAGGRVSVRQSLMDDKKLEVHTGIRPPGQEVAFPGRISGDRGTTGHLRGTSNAAALVSRACGFLYDVIEKLRQEPGGDIVDTVPPAVWLKALVPHGAEWGEAGSILTQALKNKDNSRQFKEYVTRLLGYGTVDIRRVQECTAQRVTALGGGMLTRDGSHIHCFPLPPSLSDRHGRRRLIITLAWLSPVNHRHRNWRRAELWFDPPKTPLRVDRQQANWQAVRRGTLQHEILEGKRADVFVDGDNLKIQVSCRADAGTLEDDVPYALATTLEVADEIGIDIYDEVRAAVHAVRVRPDLDA